MKRILQISKYLYPYIGGTEQVARDIMNALQDENVEQRIICFNEDAQDGEYICRRNETIHNEVDGVKVVRCGCITKVFSQSISLSYPRELKKILKNFDPEIVILHYPNPYVSSFLLPLLSKKTKFILYWHLDITKQKILGKLFHGQSIRLLKRADKVITTSPNYIVGSPYLSRFAEKCIAIPNCIRPERFAITDQTQEKLKEIKKEYPDKIICFAVGRHVPYKGMSYLIQASKYLDNRFVIFIGGKGELTESLKKEAGTDAKIHFLGRVSDEDLVSYYEACDILAFPSITKNEAFGISLAEGMYFGNPAVTFTIAGSGVNYVNLNGVTGIEVPNRNVKAYAEAITKLADDLELRKKYGANAKQRVEEKFLYGEFGKNIRRQVDLM